MQVLTTTEIKRDIEVFNLFQICPCVPYFVYTVLFIASYSYKCFERLLLCFTQFGGRSRFLNFDKSRDTSPLVIYISKYMLYFFF